MGDRDFRLDHGATWLNLIPTFTGRRSLPVVERLDSPAQLERWLEAVGLGPRRAPNAEDLRAAIELREAVYALARAAVDGTKWPSSALRVLSEALIADQSPSLRVTKGELVASAPADTRAALGRIARQAAEHLTGPERLRLRTCGDEECAGIFIDDTGRRRWCSDTRCGSRVRVRAYRARAGRDAGTLG